MANYYLSMSVVLNVESGKNKLTKNSLHIIKAVYKEVFYKIV